MRRIALLVLLLTACERAPTTLDVSHGQTLVHAMLPAGDSLAAVLITTSAPGPENVWLKITEKAVSGARVQLESASGRVELVNAPTDDACTGFPPPLTENPDLAEGCYVGVVTGGIQPGVRYTLIDLPSGRKVTGATTVPFPPSFIAPAAGAQIMTGGVQGGKEPIHVRWAGTDKAPYVTLVAGIVNEPACNVQLRSSDLFGLSLVHVTPFDSVALQSITVSCPGQSQPVQRAAELVLTAYDSTYTEYIKGSWIGSRTNAEASAGLSGAWGVFAASASARLPVTFVPAP